MMGNIAGAKAIPSCFSYKYKFHILTEMIYIIPVMDIRVGYHIFKLTIL